MVVINIEPDYFWRGLGYIIYEREKKGKKHGLVKENLSVVRENEILAWPCKAIAQLKVIKLEIGRRISITSALI